MDNFESRFSYKVYYCQNKHIFLGVYLSIIPPCYGYLLLLHGMVCVMYIMCLVFLTGQRNSMCLNFLPEHVFAASGVSIHDSESD
jgi:hypothetical protein